MRRAVLELLAPADPPAGGVAVFQYGVECARLAAAGMRGRVDRMEEHDSTLRLVSARAMLDLYGSTCSSTRWDCSSRGGVDVTCDFLGDGPERGAIEARAAERGVADRCTSHGAVTPANVERIVARSDCYVSVSESDGVSLALLEALALGAVPVLSDIPANRPWVHDGSTGVLVDIDPASVADGIVRATMLDRERVAADNLAVVAERADRDTNLAACELLIDSLVGVTWEPGGSERAA